MELKVIAHIQNDFTSKFGIPRQSGILKEMKSRIVFTPEFRESDALKGLEDFSHLWLIWGFSENKKTDWSPTVRPPRLGGNKRVGVFATRSPIRPNPLGLSCVKIESIQKTENEGVVINVLGADLLSGTPIYDIKPYISYTDAVVTAKCGFADAAPNENLAVKFADGLLEKVPSKKREDLTALLSCDPRPKYQHDPERIYSFEFADLNIKFKVDENTNECLVTEITKV